MIEAAARNGWIERDPRDDGIAAQHSTRRGASIILTYYAKGRRQAAWRERRFVVAYGVELPNKEY